MQATSKYVAMDCEMVGTGRGGTESALARCSIVDYNKRVLYDEYVKPDQPVTDYRTRFSGILPRHLVHATSYEEARKEIKKILEGKIIIGHDMRRDFSTLGLNIQMFDTRDTSLCEPLLKKAKLTVGRRASLKNLAQILLSIQIQNSSEGHCSVEDAKAVMDLFRLVDKEWERGPHSWAETPRPRRYQNRRYNFDIDFEDYNSCNDCCDGDDYSSD
ncbi:unnamed protein product [Lampetra planeri]